MLTSSEGPDRGPQSKPFLQLVGDSPAHNVREGIALASRIAPMATIDMYSQLPELDDDDSVGKAKEHVVTRDDLPDFRFEGVLLASAAPEKRGQLRWKEYRVYRTSSGKHVFSRVGRSLKEGERDVFEAAIFDPKKDGAVMTMESTAARPWQWSDGAMQYFGFDATAKVLYRKLGIESEERIE